MINVFQACTNTVQLPYLYPRSAVCAKRLQEILHRWHQYGPGAATLKSRVAAEALSIAEGPLLPPGERRAVPFAGDRVVKW